ncbi:MAG TPA: type VI secretion system baseplate subunit TssG [Nannocystis exedens]|nr:type VI secretion system baseplate subunit TssG [Nannocystis exedens]
MAGANRQLTPNEGAWLDRLVKAPTEVSLVAATRLLERIFSRQESGYRGESEPARQRERERSGQGGQGGPGGSAGEVRRNRWSGQAMPERYIDERIHFKHSSSLAMHVGEIAAVEPVGEPPVAVSITASLFGLGGSASPLPHYMSEEADADGEQGEATRGLYDVFHHRLYTLLLRGLYELDLPSSLRRDGSDPWSQRLLDYLGVSADSESAIPEAALLRLAPILASGVRSPEMLRAALQIVLEDHLGQAELRVEPMSGGWMAIDESQWTRLGLGCAVLGESFVAGTEVLHPTGAAKVVIGPLSGEHYKVFTPGQVGFARALELTAGFAPEPVHYDLVLEIEDINYPPAILGKRHLGDDFWLAHSEHRGVSTKKIVPLVGASMQDPST